VAELKPKSAAAAAEHRATNQNTEPNNKEPENADKIQSREDAKKKVARAAAITAVATNSERHPSADDFIPLSRNITPIKEENGNKNNNASSLKTSADE
jgi:membrane-associated protease RseP (regulator of RpoE activity)